MATAQHIHMGDPVNRCMFVAHPADDGAFHVLFQVLNPVANHIQDCFKITHRELHLLDTVFQHLDPINGPSNFKFLLVRVTQVQCVTWT